MIDKDEIAADLRHKDVMEAIAVNATRLIKIETLVEQILDLTEKIAKGQGINISRDLGPHTMGRDS